VYGGPETAHVVGFVDGTHVNAGFARRNGCEIARWDRLRPLVPLPSAAPVAAAAQADKPWPVPVPSWFWVWARWYLHRAEFADEPFRSDATRPDDAPHRIPDWAWLRLRTLLGGAPPREELPPPRLVRKIWPVPLPKWFWVWARWYLGRSEFAVDGPQNPHVRPPSAPRLIVEWAWRRLAVLQGEEPPPLPTTSVRRGAEGREVAALQRALNGARYVAGPADGVFGTKTRYGVLAFEQAHGLEPDGVVDADEHVRILRSRRAHAPLARPDDYVYVDLSRQILFDVRRGRVTRVLPVSTGGGYTYTGLDGRRHVAITPQGTFRVFRKVAGKDRSYLGTLYFPSYFTNGYAIHGSTNVPPRPVSHGCVRIPNYLAPDFFRRMEIGTTVVVD
jgi:peptidoglycan hydrolase-like protein with peptidoglycan-binding domain